MSDNYNKQEREIRKLIRDDYPLPVLQELIAEILLETCKGKRLEKRFSLALEAIFGDEMEKETFGYIDDERNLIQIATFVGYSRTLKKLHPGKKSVGGFPTDLTEGKAAAEIARRVCITGYKNFSGPYKGNDEEIYQKIDATTRRLKSKMKGNLNAYIKKYRISQLESVTDEDFRDREVSFIVGLIPVWLSHYGRQCIFHAKNAAKPPVQ